MGLENQDDAQFAAGYNDTPTETPEEVRQEVKEEAKAEQQPAKQEAPDPFKELAARMDKFEASQNKLAGHLGGLTRSQNEFRQLLAASKQATEKVGDAPTQTQVQEAMTDPQEWADLKKQFPEWATATEKIIDAKVGAKATPGIDPAEIDRIVSERVSRQTAENRKEMIDTYLDSVVDGSWEEEVRSDGFNKWIESQPDAVKALAQSSKMTDAAKMLRMYQQSKQTPAKPTPQQEQKNSARQERFRAAVTPKGTGGHHSSSTETDDFMAGYNS